MSELNVTGGDSQRSLASTLAEPLLAAAHANSRLAREQLRLLLDSAFKRPDDTSETRYVPRVAAFEVTQHIVQPGPHDDDGSIVPVTTTMDVPLITLLPTLFVGVERVEIDFGLHVQTEGDDPEYDPTPRYDMRIETAVQPTPSGVALLTEVYQKSITPTPLPGGEDA